MSKFFVLYWTRLFIDNGRQTSLHTGRGPTRSEEDVCTMVRRGAQWFDEGPKGPPSLLNKLRWEDEAGSWGKGVHLLQQIKLKSAAIESLYNPNVFKLRKWKQKLHFWKIHLVSGKN